ncbi:uncharacterized protein N7518_003100 [Penicillium psychrosexuale]|nr:uncharacterized protein N7518_003100 [Penicillium psychrosexuale]KAJ5801032.1 hypothetical protein N7518_003100 [Penicillium psychrosexuale]
MGLGWDSSSVWRLRGIGSFTVARGQGMESVEIVRHFVRKHREVREQSGVGRFRGGMGAKERKGVSDDQSCPQMANLPNLRRLFVEARTEAEENEYSRKAFYNLVLFISSVAIFSLTAQRMSRPKVG